MEIGNRPPPAPPFLRGGLRASGCFALSVLFLIGCGAPAPTFVHSEKAGDLVTDAQAPVKNALAEYFGTPNQLVVWEKFPIDYGKKDLADATGKHTEDGWKLKEGRNLYMIHCLHCHGVSGDGAGPTSRFLNPRPRDFRTGVLKFTSTASGVKPARSDIKRTLEQGIPGTYMPSFVLLGDEHLDAIIEYVRWLATRGEFELRLVNELAALGASKKEIEQRVADGKKSGGESRDAIMEGLRKSIKDEIAALIETVSGDVAESWTKADSPDSIVAPKAKRTDPHAMTNVPIVDEKTKEPKKGLTSIQNGRELFLSAKAKCADCHGPAGRGDGRGTEDFWPIPNTNPEQKYARPGLHDMWGQPQQPRNLATGVYRGGRRPVDLYRRLYAGIKGTQMPAFGGTVLNDEEIWDIVNYVMSIPYEGRPSAKPAEENHKVAKSETQNPND